MQERSEMQQRQGYQAVEKLRETLDEEYLWEVILLYAGESFKTYTGLPFTYEVRKGRNGDYTRELWIDRRAVSYTHLDVYKRQTLDTSGKYMKIYRQSGNTKMDNIDL